MNVLNIICGCLFLVVSIAVFMGAEVKSLGVAMAYFTGAILFFNQSMRSDKK